MNNKTLSIRMKQNFDGILRNLSPREREWAENFERMEYSIERGKAKEALEYALQLTTKPLSETFIADVKEHAAAKERCNPATMESQAKRRKSERKTTQIRTSQMYDSSDWLRTGGTYIGEDGAETEIGVTVSPESALVDAIDAARSHKVSLETYMNSPALWGQPRGKGRPKKLESV